jgi:hypothetical protein
MLEFLAEIIGELLGKYIFNALRKITNFILKPILRFFNIPSVDKIFDFLAMILLGVFLIFIVWVVF